MAQAFHGLLSGEPAGGQEARPRDLTCETEAIERDKLMGPQTARPGAGAGGSSGGGHWDSHPQRGD